MPKPQFESVVAEADSFFRCVHLRCDDFAADHAWHCHPEYELLWVIRSQGTRFVGDSIERYGPGDLALVGPNMPHCYRNDPSIEGAEGPEWIVLQFDPRRLGDAFFSLPELEPVRRLLDEAGRGLSFPPKISEQVAPLMRALAAQSGLARLARLLDILALLTGCEARAPLAAPDYHLVNRVDRTHIQRIETVQAYIRANLCDSISQAEIAERLGMKAPAFSKFFRAATGQTFMGLVKVLRVNEACRLLGDTSRRITDIALECGYQHTSHFDQQFFEVKGMSPTDYRRLAQLRAVGVTSNSPRAALA